MGLPMVSHLGLVASFEGAHILFALNLFATRSSISQLTSSLDEFSPSRGNGQRATLHQHQHLH